MGIAVNPLRLIRKLNPEVSLEERTPYFTRKADTPKRVKIKLQVSVSLSGQRRAAVPSEAFWSQNSEF